MLIALDPNNAQTTYFARASDVARAAWNRDGQMAAVVRGTA